MLRVLVIVAYFLGSSLKLSSADSFETFEYPEFGRKLNAPPIEIQSTPPKVTALSNVEQQNHQDLQEAAQVYYIEAPTLSTTTKKPFFTRRKYRKRNNLADSNLSLNPASNVTPLSDPVSILEEPKEQMIAYTHTEKSTQLLGQSDLVGKSTKVPEKSKRRVSIQRRFQRFRTHEPQTSFENEKANIPKDQDSNILKNEGPKVEVSIRRRRIRKNKFQRSGRYNDTPTNGNPDSNPVVENQNRSVITVPENQKNNPAFGLRRRKTKNAPAIPVY